MSANTSVTPAQRYNPAATLPGQPGYQATAAIPAYPFATFGKRLIASLVDTAVVAAILCLPTTVGVVSIVNGVGTNANGDANTVTNAWLLSFGIAAIIVGAVCALLYEPFLTARKGAHNGQTLGKQVAGVRITTLRGEPISTGQAWGRSLFKAFISDSPFYLGYLWMLWDGQKQTWHDKVASTYVLAA